MPGSVALPTERGNERSDPPPLPSPAADRATNLSPMPVTQSSSCGTTFCFLFFRCLPPPHQRTGRAHGEKLARERVRRVFCSQDALTPPAASGATGICRHRRGPPSCPPPSVSWPVWFWGACSGFRGPCVARSPHVETDAAAPLPQLLLGLASGQRASAFGQVRCPQNASNYLFLIFLFFLPNKYDD